MARKTSLAAFNERSCRTHAYDIHGGKQYEITMGITDLIRNITGC